MDGKKRERETDRQTETDRETLGWMPLLCPAGDAGKEQLVGTL